MGYAIGLDIGTTTVSAVLTDEDNGRVVFTKTTENDAGLPGKFPEEHIQDADRIVSIVCRTVDELKVSWTPIVSIGIDGQMHGILYLDDEGKAISPLFTWQDGRGNLPFWEGETYSEYLTRMTGHQVSSGYGLVTHFWNLKNGYVPENASKIATIFDYAGMVLTGRKVPLTHTSGGASLGFFDLSGDKWDREALKAAGIGEEILPEMTDSYTVLGYDRDHIPVSVAVGDNQASFLGSVSDTERMLLINMGTGGQISCVTRVPTGEGLESRPLGEGKRIAVGASLCGGRSYALLEKFLESCIAITGQKPNETLYGTMNLLAGCYDPDRSSLRVDTRFCGSRKEPGVKGSIIGITPDHFDAAHLIGAFLYGMAEELKTMYDGMLAAGVAPAVQAVGSGNAIRKNPTLKKAFEKVFGLPVRIPESPEEAACGAALVGLVAAGRKKNMGEAQRLIRYL